MQNINALGMNKNKDDALEDQYGQIEEQALRIRDLEEENRSMKRLIDNLMEMSNAMNAKVLQIQDIQLKDKSKARLRPSSPGGPSEHDVREIVKKELSYIKTDKFYKEIKKVETFEKIAQTPKITKTNAGAQTPFESKKLF